jgi:hypothetical protein
MHLCRCRICGLGGSGTTPRPHAAYWPRPRCRHPLSQVNVCFEIFEYSLKCRWIEIKTGWDWYDHQKHCLISWTIMWCEQWAQQWQRTSRKGCKRSKSRPKKEPKKSTTATNPSGAQAQQFAHWPCIFVLERARTSLYMSARQAESAWTTRPSTQSPDLHNHEILCKIHSKFTPRYKLNHWRMVEKRGEFELSVLITSKSILGWYLKLQKNDLIWEPNIKTKTFGRHTKNRPESMLWKVTVTNDFDVEFLCWSSTILLNVT